MRYVILLCILLFTSCSHNKPLNNSYYNTIGPIEYDEADCLQIEQNSNKTTLKIISIQPNEQYFVVIDPLNRGDLYTGVWYLSSWNSNVKISVIECPLRLSTIGTKHRRLN